MDWQAGKVELSGKVEMAEVLDADFDMEEGEEEPLFIDDDLEDPPPLPPPMPSLSQLNQHHSTVSSSILYHVSW